MSKQFHDPDHLAETASRAADWARFAEQGFANDAILMRQRGIVSEMADVDRFSAVPLALFEPH
jgi:hypothetical protein